LSEIKKRYVVRFKRKDLRENKRDDKITILKNAVNMNTRRITRRDERVLAVHEVGENSTALAEDPEKIVDINEYTVPLAIVSLSPDQAEALKKDRNVEVVYEDKPANIRLTDLRVQESEILPFAPNDEAPRREYITENIKRMNAHNAWAYKTGYAVKVAVMDTGIDKTHPDLAANFKGGTAVIAGDSSPPGTRNDSSGGFHGTGCAGIIGAVRGNGQGVVGMAPDCFLYDIRVFGITGRAISTGELTAAYAWAGNNNMDVCNMSFGQGPFARYDQKNDWESWMTDQNNTLTAGRAKGTLYVAGSGNDGDNGKRSNKLADRFYPAAYDAVASVSAIQDHLVAEFSNTGDSVNFTAPGTNNQGSPNESTPYGLTTYAGRSGFDNKVYSNAYGWFNGTSMAAPHVSGVMALAYSAYKPEACVTAYNGLGTVFQRPAIIARVVGFTCEGPEGGPALPMGQDLTIGLGIPNAERAVRMLLNIDQAGMTPIPTSLDSSPIQQSTKVLFQ
jgi:subtilisin family serine protease